MSRSPISPSRHALVAALLAGGLALTTPPLAQAQDGTQDKPAASDKVELTAPLLLNARYLGDISVRVDTSGMGDIDAQRLIELLSPVIGPDALAVLEERVRGRQTVSMTELSTGELSVNFDPGLLEVTAQLSASSLGLNRVPLVERFQPDPDDFDAPEDFALGLGVTLSHGYRFEGERGAGFEPARANFEGYAQVGGFDGAALFYAFDVDEAAQKTVRRREVQLIKDFYGSAIRTTLGDLNAPTTAFQSAPPLLGFSVAREYRAIRPFQNIVSSGRGEITLERDSEVDVFVNGALSETLRLQAGRYSLTDFPVRTGSNDVQLRIEDDTGRVETADFSVFSQSGLLGEGLLDFAATVGVPRRQSAGGFDYGGSLMASGFVDYGLTEWLTVGGNAQVRDSRQQLGASASIGTPIGLFSADATQSFGDGASGQAVGADYLHAFDTGRTRWTANASALYRTREFGTLNLFTTNPTRFEAQALIRAQFTDGISAALSLRLRDEYDRPDERRANLTLGKFFGSTYFTVSTDLIERDGEDTQIEATLGLTHRFGLRNTARAQYRSREDEALFELARSRQRDLNDLSGRVQFLDSDREERLRTNANFRHNRFEAEADLITRKRRGEAAGRPRETVADWRVSTFFGLAGGKLGIGRRSDSGFILVDRHRSLADSDVVAFDQSGQRREARVGALGPALIPIERGYTPRRYTLEVDPLPIGYDLGSGRIDALPSVGLGYVYEVGSDASRTVLGTVLGPDGEPLARAVGTLEAVDGDPEASRQFFTNSAGRMVAERIAAGEYVIVIDDARSDPITIDSSTEGLVNVGTIQIP